MPDLPSDPVPFAHPGVPRHCPDAAMRCPLRSIPVQLLTIEAAAEALSTSVSTVRRLLQERQLRPVRFARLVRIRADDLAAFIERNTEDHPDDADLSEPDLGAHRSGA